MESAFPSDQESNPELAPPETGTGGAEPGEATELLPVVYGELRRLAKHYIAGERRDHTLQPTALVHEAYLRLIDIDRMQWNSKTHFYSMAATEMRRVLIDYARARNASKRGGKAQRVLLQDETALADGPSLELLALDEALNHLSEIYPRQAQVAVYRLFAGMQVTEIASVLDVSDRTIKNDWRLARAWLARELRHRDHGSAVD